MDLTPDRRTQHTEKIKDEEDERTRSYTCTAALLGKMTAAVVKAVRPAGRSGSRSRATPRHEN
jgi:hypothetical protein